MEDLLKIVAESYKINRRSECYAEPGAILAQGDGNKFTWDDAVTALGNAFKHTHKEEATIFTNVGWYGELTMKSYSSKTTGSGNIRVTTTNGIQKKVSFETAIMTELIRASINSNIGAMGSVSLVNLNVTAGVSVMDGFSGSYGLYDSSGALHGYSFNLKPSPELTAGLVVAGALIGIPTYLLAF